MLLPVGIENKILFVWFSTRSGLAEIGRGNHFHLCSAAKSRTKLISGLFFTLNEPHSRQVEEEIQTLSQVLAAKEKHLAEIKRKLGINSLQELKQNIAKGWQDVTATSAYVSLTLPFSREPRGHFAVFVWKRGGVERDQGGFCSFCLYCAGQPSPPPPFSSVSGSSLTGLLDCPRV